MWAVYALGDRGDMDLDATLGGMVTAKDTNMAAQAVLDVVMSKRRVERLIKLVSGDLTETQAQVVANRVMDLVKRGEFPHIGILLQACVNNPKNPPQVQAIYKELLANHQKGLY